MAQFFSVVCAPFFSGPALFVPLGTVLTAPRQRPVVLGILLLGTNVLPFIMALLMMRRGDISDLHIDRRAERPLYFALCLACGVISEVLLALLPGPRILIVLMFCYVLSFAAITVRTLFTKVSAHCTALGALCATTWAFFPAWGAAATLALVLTAWARIHQQRHTLSQCIEGTCIGGGFFGLGVVGLRWLGWI